MQTFPIEFAQAAQSPSKRPRYVVRIVFDTASPACTSHDDIPNVPGDVIDGVLREPSAISQRIVPDEGRSEIGSFTFSLIDRSSEFTDAIRAKLLTDLEGIRGRKVIFYEGYEGFDFTDFQVFQTQVVQNASYADGAYTVRCQDITREQRKSILEPKFTTLRDSVSETDTTIPVYVTTGFETIVHGTSWSDSPSSTVGYIRIESEVIRYTGKTSDSFTGCTRGVLNTQAVAHAVDAGTAAERRTKVEEYIYLELPAVKLAWAILTGELYGSANVLPSHWHLGIDTALIRESDFTGIGLDLWDPSDDAAALPLRFEGLKKTDGKRFLEKEIYLLLGCYSPIYSDGTLGLRRLPALLGDAAPIATLTEREITSIGELLHDDQSMHNVFRVNWNHDPIKDQFTRITYYTDADSVSIHGSADLKEYSFKGLHGSRHTDAIVAQRLNALRDAYSHPPETIPVTVQGSLSYLEIGDVVRLKVANVRDYAGTTSSIDRAFAILQKTHHSARNEVSLDLFGSTARPLATPPGTGSSAPLPDAWYTSEGASLDTIATITANAMATGNYTINGATTLTASGAIFYWDADLTIPNGCNLTITANVQLRIRGFFTLNGTINGVGGGKAGVADPGTGSWDATFAGNPGYIGHSRGWDGIHDQGQVPRTPHRNAVTQPAVTTRGQNDAFPPLNLSVSGSSLVGLPTDMRGTGGAPGGRIIERVESGGNFISQLASGGNGGTGGDGGAGLAIICRGMSFGVSASITLNGDDTTSPGLVTIEDVTMHPGAGGPGGPGALLILLDGNSISIPDVTGKVIAATGGMTQSGNPMIERRTILPSVYVPTRQQPGPPHCGYPDPGIVGDISYTFNVPTVTVAAKDMSNAAHRIQYITESQTVDPDESTKPPAPSGLAAGHVLGGNALFWSNPSYALFDVVEIFSSIDNDRANAIKVGEIRGDSFLHPLPLGGLRYYWIRLRRNEVDGRPPTFSDWHPSSATAGESSNIETPGEVPDAPADFTATGITNAIVFEWSLPAYARLSGLIEIYEHTSSTPFSSATKIWEGYAFRVIHTVEDTTTRYYWVALRRSGILSVPSPPTEGVPAAATGIVSVLWVITDKVFVSKSAGVPPPNPKTITTDAVTAVASGGVPAYTYQWTWYAGGAGITIDSPTSATTTFSGTNIFDGTVLSGTALITVTDSLSAIATYVCVVQLSWPSIG